MAGDKVAVTVAGGWSVYVDDRHPTPVGIEAAQAFPRTASSKVARPHKKRHNLERTASRGPDVAARPSGPPQISAQPVRLDKPFCRSVWSMTGKISTFAFSAKNGSEIFGS